MVSGLHCTFSYLSCACNNSLSSTVALLDSKQVSIFVCEISLAYVVSAGYTFVFILQHKFIFLFVLQSFLQQQGIVRKHNASPPSFDDSNISIIHKRNNLMNIISLSINGARDAFSLHNN